MTDRRYAKLVAARERARRKRAARWDEVERQAFRDGNRRRAQTIQGKRKPAPTVREWA